MHWYVIHTKPRQEKRALSNLEEQGYECYLPFLKTEKVGVGLLREVEEPLFPRYLFIKLDTSLSAKSWGPIRSTKGVSSLVSFGNQPTKVNPILIDTLRSEEATRMSQTERMFEDGEHLTITKGPFAGLEAIYRMKDSDHRVMVLIEFLNKPIEFSLPPSYLQKD